MGFSRQEYWSGLTRTPPGDLPNPGIKPESLMSPARAGRFFTTSATWKPILEYFTQIISLDRQKSLRKNILPPILQIEAK